MDPTARVPRDDRLPVTRSVHRLGPHRPAASDADAVSLLAPTI
jgi:hypothetical protein